ncbi:hypothetical protein GCM10029978_045480 [Actinoallomurus acanthiterrae]
MLTTLAFLFPHTALGTVTIYPLEEDFGRAWRNLPGYSDGGTSRPRRPAYAALATALSAVSGQPVILMPDSYQPVDDELACPAVAITTRPFDPDVLKTAVQAWERRITGDDAADTLSPILSRAQIQARQLADYVRGSQQGRPHAPQWFYRVAAWSFAERLARAPMTIPNGNQPLNVRWRMDTRGSLLSWDHLAERSINRQRDTGYSIHKLDFRVITLPGEPLFAVHVLPTFSRLATHWARTRTAFIARGKDIILRLPVGHRPTGDGAWQAYVRNYAAEVVEACGMEVIDLPTNDELQAMNGPVRVLVPGPCQHPLGKGVGTRFNKILAEHITQTVRRPKIQQVAYARTPIKLERPVKGPIARTDIDQAVLTTGHKRARIIVLYSDGTTRRRIATTLAQYATTPDTPIDCSDRQDHPLTDRLVVHFRRVPAIDSANPVDWNAELQFIDHLDNEDTLNGAWVETIWNPKPTKKQRERDGARHDHKRDLRRALYNRGIVSQFLARQATTESTDEPNTPEGVGDVASEPTDHKALSAMRDLLFRLGVVDNRLSHVTQLGGRPILVGIHLRQQRVSDKKPGGADRTQMVEVLTAVHTASAPGEPWRVTTYDHHSHDWLPQAQAEPAFGCGPIGRNGHARHQDGALLVREHIESALRLLPADRPIIIFLDAEACRTIWPGLQHTKLGDGPLPGDSLLPADRSVSVVTINTSYGEVPTPVEDTTRRRTTLKRPAKPQDYLYHRTTSTGVTSWYIAQASRAYTGYGQDGSIGGLYTRFTIPTEQHALLRKDWHSFTATHITVPRATGYAPEDLAALAARLCHQTLAWDARTRHSVPLHIAGAVDRSHPEYRGPSIDNPEQEALNGIDSEG